MRIFKKPMAVLIAAVLFVNMFAVNLTAFAATPETVAAWDYTGAPASANVPATSGINASGAVLSNFANVTPTNSSSSLCIGNKNGDWSTGAATKYWQVSMSTLNYENLSISAKVRSSGTGPRDFKLLYSMDGGTNFNPVPDSSYKITSTSLSSISFMKDSDGTTASSVSLPADAANCSNLAVRFIMTSNISSRAGTGTYLADDAVASGGTSNINNISIQGTKTGSQPSSSIAPVTATPSVTPGANNSVPSGTTVSLACATAGVTIHYSLNNSSTDQIYNAGTPIVLNDTTTIKAYAVLDADHSDTYTFTYTVNSPVPPAPSRPPAPRAAVRPP